MPPSKPSPGVTLACLSVLAAVGIVSVPRPADAATCFEAISGQSSQKLFDALATATPSDGCTLENVTTDKAQMKVEWKKGGRLVEAILILPTSCTKGPATNAKMSTLVPPSAEAACPAAVDATRKLVEGGTLGDLVAVSDGIPIAEADARPAKSRRRLVIGLVGGGLAAAAAAFGAIFAVRRRRRKVVSSPPTQPTPTEDPGASTDGASSPASPDA
jgi:hypothetical protein